MYLFMYIYIYILYSSPFYLCIFCAVFALEELSSSFMYRMMDIGIVLGS